MLAVPRLGRAAALVLAAGILVCSGGADAAVKPRPSPLQPTGSAGKSPVSATPTSRADSRATATPTPSPLGAEEAVRSMRKRWTGDFDVIVKRRIVRVLTVYNKTGYFLDGIQQKGVNADAFREFEKDVNLRLGTTNANRIHVLMIPVSRDELIPGLLEGRGDLASANLTITPERLKLVDFAVPELDNVSEIAVTPKGVRALLTPEDLSGRDVHVRASSSHFVSLTRLNEALRRAGKPPVNIVKADELLETEDLLEMVNAGLIPITIADSHIASFWAQVMDNIALHRRAAVRSGGQIGIAFRKNSPKLEAVINEFVRTHRAGTFYGNILLRKYLKRTDFIRNASAREEMARFRSTIALFRKYAGRYGFDALMLAAQGYQESRLDQTVRSPAGAIGVMQVLPGTAKDVGVPDIHKVEDNINAGAKYMRRVHDAYFARAPMSPIDKGLFCFAAYNAGPGRVSQLRRKAARMGLDPNRWFGNVEVVAAQEIGRETVQYVSNIYKYYVSYRLVLEQQERRKKPKE